MRSHRRRRPGPGPGEEDAAAGRRAALLAERDRLLSEIEALETDLHRAQTALRALERELASNDWTPFDPQPGAAGKSPSRLSGRGAGLLTAAGRPRPPERPPAPVAPGVARPAPGPTKRGAPKTARQPAWWRGLGAVEKVLGVCQDYVSPCGDTWARKGSQQMLSETLPRATYGTADASEEATAPLPASAGAVEIEDPEVVFARLFAQYEQPIYQYVYRLLGDPEDARDFTQDAFVKAYRKLPETLAKGEFQPQAWLYRIATNVCLDELRHRKLVKWQPWELFVSLFHPSQVARDNPERDALQDETRHEVEAVLDRLSPATGPR